MIYPVILKIFIFNVKLKIFSKVSVDWTDTKNMQGGHFKILTVLREFSKLKVLTKPHDVFIASDNKQIANLLTH
jgi:hypothetical protein